MGRRRSRRKAAPRSAPNPWLIAFQILILVGALIAIISFRDNIGSGTGALVESLSSEDISVEQQGGEGAGDDETPLPADRTDDQESNSDDEPSPHDVEGVQRNGE